MERRERKGKRGVYGKKVGDWKDGKRMGMVKEYERRRWLEKRDR